MGLYDILRENIWWIITIGVLASLVYGISVYLRYVDFSGFFG